MRLRTYPVYATGPEPLTELRRSPSSYMTNIVRWELAIYG
jgi:hypothetical protein